MVDPVIVQTIADPLIVAVEDKIAAAQSTIASAQTTTSVAQTATSVAQTQIAASVSKIANLDNVPFSDYVVWLTIATARAQHPNIASSSVPEVVTFADKILAQFKQRFPRDMLAGSASRVETPAPTSSDFLPDLNVSLFQPVTSKTDA